MKYKNLCKKIKLPLVNFYNEIYDLNKIRNIILYNYFHRVLKFKPKIMTIEESLKYLINNRCSLGRFGDGEMKIIRGESLPFQEYSPELKSRLTEVLKSKKNNFKVGIPDVFESLRGIKYSDREFWEKNMKKNRDVWYEYLDKNTKYINSFITRPYIIFKNTSKSEFYFELIKKIWKDKDIIIIEGEESRLGVGNDLFDNVKSIERILAPSENAFSIYNDILEFAKKLPKNKMILIALGPAATVLAYDLSVIGYQAIDIGHIDLEYEWYLLKATKKINLDNKYVHEIKEGRNALPIYDKKYNNEIIYHLKNKNC